MISRILASCALLSLLACAPAPLAPSRATAAEFDLQRYARDLQTLSSDAFAGRAPGSAAEERTVTYIADAFRSAGVAPANRGSYFQRVPLVGISAAAVTPMTFSDDGGAFEYRQQMMVWTKQLVEQVGLADSQLVFVGYGIVAPEFDWDDYAGVDVKGKTVVVLVNDPGYATRNPALFNGSAMTYYGRWTYKYAEAARQGAAGVLIVHETAAAGYPWDVITGSWGGAQFDLGAPDGNLSRAAIEGWLSRDAAASLFERGGLNFAELSRAAARPGFSPRRMNLAVSVTVTSRIRKFYSRNVAGRIEGVRRPSETILYMAHWDHLGIDPSLKGDQIFNGAVDNASGLAGLLELARVFGRGPRPGRSVVFLALTAEESGLLGSEYYAGQPLYPLATTVAGFNMDGLNVNGPTRDVVVVGYGSSELEGYLADAAATQGRVMVPEPTPEKGFFYRSDHFNFAKSGVPVLYAKSGVDQISQGSTYGRRKAWEYAALRYHKVTDEFDPGWDLRGALLDLKLIYRVGTRLSNSSVFPNWYPGNEFRALRDRSAAQRGG